MGWANCGTDSKGRPIGYAHVAACDAPGCTKKIDRGLSYACGGEHGADIDYCEDYFCEQHLVYCEVSDKFVCEACAKMNEACAMTPTRFYAEETEVLARFAERFGRPITREEADAMIRNFELRCEDALTEDWIESVTWRRYIESDGGE